MEKPFQVTSSGTPYEVTLILFSKGWNHVALITSAIALSFGMVANAYSSVEFKCKPAPETLSDMAREGQIPALTYFIDGREQGSKTPTFSKVIITVNPATMSGYEVSKAGNLLCTVAKLDTMKFYRNDQQALDGSIFVQTELAKKSGGVNNVIYGDAKQDGVFPMLKAHRTIPGLKAEHLFFVSAHPITGKGATFAATSAGVFDSKYTKAIEAANPAEGVTNGAQFTPVGEKLAN